MPTSATLSWKQASEVIENAEMVIVSPAFWRRAALNGVQIGATAALTLLDKDPAVKRFERYHERPDYSSAGKGAGAGPIMRLSTLRSPLTDMYRPVAVAENVYTEPFMHLRQVGQALIPLISLLLFLGDLLKENIHCLVQAFRDARYQMLAQSQPLPGLAMARTRSLSIEEPRKQSCRRITDRSRRLSGLCRCAMLPLLRGSQSLSWACAGLAHLLWVQ